MRSLGHSIRQGTRVYLTGGATAVLMGWRPSTVDIDLYFVPESDEVFRALQGLKERLELNVEMACPADFIPELPNWRERSLFIAQEGRCSFYHYDPYAQALAKAERGHAQDVADVKEMLRRDLVEPERALELFEAVEPRLYRYPSLDAKAFRRSVEHLMRP